MKGLLTLRGKHIAGKCTERCQIGSGNGEVPAERGWRGMEDGVLAGAVRGRGGWQPFYRAGRRARGFHTYSRTSLLNCFLLLPRNSPIIWRLRPFRWSRKCATPMGVSGMKPREIRNWIPLSGFLKGKDRDTVSLHDLSEALLPLSHLTACSNAALGMCMGSCEFMCVAGMGLVKARKSNLEESPPVATEDKRMAWDLPCHLQHLLSPGDHKCHPTAAKDPAAP